MAGIDLRVEPGCLEPGSDLAVYFEGDSVRSTTAAKYVFLDSRRSGRWAREWEVVIPRLAAGEPQVRRARGIDDEVRDKSGLSAATTLRFRVPSDAEGRLRITWPVVGDGGYADESAIARVGDDCP